MGMCVSKAALHLATRDSADGGFVSSNAVKMVSEKDRPELSRRMQEKRLTSEAKIKQHAAALGMKLPDGMFESGAQRC